MVASLLSDSRGLIIRQVLEGITLIPLIGVVTLSLLKLKSKKGPLRLGFTLMKPAPVMLIIYVILAIVANSPIRMRQPQRLTLAVLEKLFGSYGCFFVVLSLLYLGLGLIDQQYTTEGQTNPKARAQQMAKSIVLGFMSALALGLLICIICYIAFVFRYYNSWGNSNLFHSGRALTYLLLAVSIILLVASLGLLLLSFPVLLFKNAADTKKTRVFYFVSTIALLVNTCFNLAINIKSIAGLWRPREGRILLAMGPVFSLWPMVFIVCLICAMGIIGPGCLWCAASPAPMLDAGVVEEKEQQRQEVDQSVPKDRHSRSSADIK